MLIRRNARALVLFPFPPSFLSFSFFGGHSEKAALGRPVRKLSPDLDCANTLTQTPSLWSGEE